MNLVHTSVTLGIEIAINHSEYEAGSSGEGT
jgi:hypothetical protein